MKVTICCVAVGGWYPRGAARLITEFHRTHSPDEQIKAGLNITLQTWVNCYPPATVSVFGEGRDWRDYTPYAAKPAALKYALDSGADIAILVDASFFPIRSIAPLVHHIVENGYYLCDNGNRVGEWTSDKCLAAFGISREEANLIQEVSSYVVGINAKAISPENVVCRIIAEDWWIYSNQATIAGHHTAGVRPQIRRHLNPPRNQGWVSDDPNVKGHRHDQSVLSIVAHQLGLKTFCQRPLYTTYLGHETQETVLVAQGMTADSL